MRRLLTVEECKSIQIEILDEIDSYCSSNGLKYSLGYGTLLGAVRHHGYIPWDDDIDIIMSRPHYEMFLKSFKSEKNVVLDLNESNFCIENFAKVSRKHTFMKDMVLGRELWGVNVDIFPIDGFPEDGMEERYGELSRLYSWAPKLCPFYKVVGSGKAKWFIKYLFKRIRFPHSGDCAAVKREVRERLLEYPFGSSPMAGYFGDGINEFMPREWFEEFTTLVFEGKAYPAISHYDEHLRAFYGNYMELPPVEQRVTHHLYDSYIEE